MKPITTKWKTAQMRNVLVKKDKPLKIVTPARGWWNRQPDYDAIVKQWKKR
jgi:hypothetical protein